MLYKAWKVKKYNEASVSELMNRLEIPRITAILLCERGYSTPEQAFEFLEHSTAISDPFLLRDMDKGVERIWQAIENGEKILVFGDYDVDGVTATAIVTDYLRSVGADVKCMLPNRLKDGYGLSNSKILKIIEDAYQLVITVDTGISLIEETEVLKKAGIDLVITDHHLPAETIPSAIAVIDPQRKDDTSPNKSLCGAGVAFKLCCALEQAEPEEMLERCGDLTAIGTIADVMELTGENRTIVNSGLKALKYSERCGLLSLVELAGISEKVITAENISYYLAPKINAAGRMGNAGDALRLMLCENEELAYSLAQNLIKLNNERKVEELKALNIIEKKLSDHFAVEKQNVLVFYHEDFHPGIIGIVANKIAEKYGKPVLILSIEGDMAKGSGRSIEGFNLHSALAGCADCLEHFGGHAMAAGFSLRKEKIQDFIERINNQFSELYQFESVPEWNIDAILPITMLTRETVQAVELLEPFGKGNDRPLFMIENVLIESVTVLKGIHCKIRFSQNGVSAESMLFNTVKEQFPYPVGSNVDMLISINTYKNQYGEQRSINIRAIRPNGQGNEVAVLASLYNSFVRGKNLNSGQKSALMPDKELFTEIYKYIRSFSLNSDDLQPLFQQLGEHNTGKILTSITAMLQLGLICKNSKKVTDNSDVHFSFYATVPVSGKKDWLSAPIFQKLEVE